MKKVLTVILWYSVALALVIFVNNTYYSYTGKNNSFLRQNPSSESSSLVFGAVPGLALEIKTAIAAEDARPIVINEYLDRYNSPLSGMGNFITSVADEFAVDPYLIIAIAQQESNLGKITPPACHNAWGWGIHSAGTLCFENWDEGILTFTEGISESYHAYGLYTPDEIMSKYVPHSPEGAWAKGVTQFLDDLEHASWN